MSVSLLHYLTRLTCFGPAPLGTFATNWRWTVSVFLYQGRVEKPMHPIAAVVLAAPGERDQIQTPLVILKALKMAIVAVWVDSSRLAPTGHL
jgi:hypothetical protein